MGQGIQEWTKQSILKAVFHKVLLDPFLKTLTHIYCINNEVFHVSTVNMNKPAENFVHIY